MERPRPVKEGFAAGAGAFRLRGSLVGMGLERSFVHRERTVGFGAGGGVASLDGWGPGGETDSDVCALGGEE